MAKAMGLNTIALYVMWNFAEEKEGVFDFTTDRRDIAAFLRPAPSHARAEHARLYPDEGS